VDDPGPDSPERDHTAPADAGPYTRCLGDRAAHDRAAHDRAAHDRAAHDRAAHDRAAHDRAAHDRAIHDPGADATVRTGPQLGKDFVASIKDLGVLVPIAAVRSDAP
jgi:hypothetical protein